MGVIGLIVAGSVVAMAAGTLVLIALVSSLAGVRRYRMLLIGSILAAGAALLLVTGWMLAEPGTSKGDALKTGGLAGGAILAVYALWINDRRRRTEEARHEVERGRAQQDRDRVDDERFAKAVEMLGHEADQVRVGALHALAGLARNRSSYTQTVLDVLCAYLRRPFTHPSYEILPRNPDEAQVEPNEVWTAERIVEADRERQVRRTAQRLIADLVPGADASEAVHYDLDFTAASLEYLELSGRQIGRLTARRTRFYGAARFTGVRIHEWAMFSSVVFHGRADFGDARFDGGVSLLRARFEGVYRVPGAIARGVIDLRTTAPQDQVGVLTVIDDAKVKLNALDGWSIQKSAD